MKPTTNNLEGWEKFLRHKYFEHDYIDILNEEVKEFGDEIVSYIKQIRKHDELELIKIFTGINLLSPSEAENEIKKYYN
jgi:hypothetical protein